VNGRGGDWLDVLARRSVREVVGVRELEPTSNTSRDERLSRESVLKLAVAGAASLSLAAWRVPRAEAASDLSECLTGCKEDYNEALARQLRGCAAQAERWKAKPGRAWDVIWRFTFYPVQFLNDASHAACDVVAWRSTEGRYRECRQNCADSCAGSGSRALQASRQTCEPTPPPPPYTPAPPPAPNHTETPCWACQEAGGICCGPFTGDPSTGVFTPCACANPSVGCEAYGCGG
jgi:hypothetical protein